MDIETARHFRDLLGHAVSNLTATTSTSSTPPAIRTFSEDTYRVLVAADSAVMLIDAAKGVEAQTIKLFKVCRLRNIPIFTFVNKMDRAGKDPFAP